MYTCFKMAFWLILKGPLCRIGNFFAVFSVCALTFLYTAPPTASELTTRWRPFPTHFYASHVHLKPADAGFKCRTWHSVIATHLRNTTASEIHQAINHHSGSLVSKYRTVKTQYGIKGNFFVNHFSFIINCHIYISSVSVLDYKCLISPEFQRFFRYMLWRKPLIHLRNVCFEFSVCCVLISVVKRLKYLISINRINAIVKWRLIWHIFFYSKYPLISCC
jgi:hypothetical protein